MNPSTLQLLLPAELRCYSHRYYSKVKLQHVATGYRISIPLIKNTLLCLSTLSPLICPANTPSTLQLFEGECIESVLLSKDLRARLLVGAIGISRLGGGSVQLLDEGALLAVKMKVLDMNLFAAQVVSFSVAV